MVSSEALVRLSKKTYRRLINNEGNFLKIVQLVGANPQNMAESAIINEDFGANVIDINMGCPARKIISNDSGSALMKNEDLAVKIAESVVKSVKIPVTLKMRLGWDNEHCNCLSLAKKFEEVGIQMLTIHCRTRNQMYSGKADWSFIKELRDIVKIPYLCNGDIKSEESAVQALQESRAHGIMIGRAALGKPWILNQIMKFLNSDSDNNVDSNDNRKIVASSIVASPTIEEQFKIIMNHFDATLDFYGQLQGIKIFRKHFCWYSSGLSGSSNFRETINHSEDISFIKNYVEDFYKKHFGAIL
jgi:tRNA-dihydrouridine synthase B